jgi:amidase
MAYFEQEIFIQSEARGPVTEPTYTAAREACLRFTRNEGIDEVLSKYKLDAICTLSSGPTNLTDLVNGDYDTGSCTFPPAIAGYPHITVPAAFISELPVGLSFFGTEWSEPTLLKLAYAFEQNTKVRRKPRYLARE